MTPYQLTRYDWPSGWYFVWVLDWRVLGFCAEVSIGSESPYGYEYGIDFQIGPLYVDGGICRKTRSLLTLLRPSSQEQP